MEEGKPKSSASICELDEGSKIVKTLSTFSPKDPSLKLLKTEFQKSGDRLALLGENTVTICDVKEGGKEMKVSLHNFNDKLNLVKNVNSSPTQKAKKNHGPVAKLSFSLVLLNCFKKIKQT